MGYYRNYTPVFTKTNEEYLAEMKQLLKESHHKIVIVPNQYPYNCKWLRQNIDIDHLVMWYSDETDMHWIRHKEKELLNEWYSVREVPREEKSVDHPHRHFLKERLSN